jgi:dUTP pyrophosphatase
MKMKIKLLNNDAVIPKRGTEDSAGYDIYSTDETIIKAGETCLIGTGIACEIPKNYFGGVFARSGLSVKEGLRPANCVAVIDADYRGEIRVPLHNDSKEDRTITKGERIAQLVILPFLPVEFEETDELSSTDRGTGGFGSTGKA